MPPTRQQRYTCQISIGSTRKSRGKKSPDPAPDGVQDSEWRPIKGETYRLTKDGEIRLQTEPPENNNSLNQNQIKGGSSDLRDNNENISTSVDTEQGQLLRSGSADDRQTGSDIVQLEKSDQSELRNSEGDINANVTNDGRTCQVGELKNTESVNSEPEKLNVDTSDGVAGDGQMNPESVQQKPISVSLKLGQVKDNVLDSRTNVGRIIPQKVHDIYAKLIGSEPERSQEGTPKGSTDDAYICPQNAQGVHANSAGSVEPGQFHGDTPDGTNDGQIYPQTVQGVHANSVGPEPGQFHGDTPDGTDDGKIYPQTVQGVNANCIGPEPGQFHGDTPDGTDDRQIYPQTVQGVHTNSVEPEHLKGVNTNGTNGRRTGPTQITDNPNSVEPEHLQRDACNSAAGADDGRKRAQTVRREDNTTPDELKNEADDKHKHLKTLQGKNFSKSVCPKLRQSYLDFFNKADILHLGQLTVHQFRDAVVKLGFTGTTFQIAEMFADLNPNDDLIVTLDAFMTEMCKSDSRTWTEQDREELFHFMDQDGDGLITETDIMTSLEQQGKVKMDDEIRHMIIKYDFDHDGALSLQDFQRGCQRDQRILQKCLSSDQI
ncbi:uncharacterized protein [Argopecten irradians]|uniref:uncharacterized protein n=1 Tax=Argopecten irradians TaxID=31199 RepID=UPI003719EB3A